MKHTITNDFLSVGVLEKGAELASIYKISDKKEYIWQADDERYWTRHSGILFPTIGKCNKGRIRINNSHYPMPKHGIVRNVNFDLIEKSKHSLVFELRSSEESKLHYPFDWTLRVYYEIDELSLSVSYEVINAGEEVLPYSIGGHPAFNCPLDKSLKRSDYNLVFDKEEHQNSPRITINGLISDDTVNIMDESNIIVIDDDLFDKDALILTHPNSSKVKLESINSTEFELVFDGFSHLGIWSSNRNAPFVCLEPWCGIADPEGYEGDFYSKPGVVQLDAQESARHTHVINIL